MGCSMPGLPIHHQLLEFTQTHGHCVSDAIQLSHPPSSPSPPAFNLSKSGSFQMSQLFSSGGQSIGVSASTSVLPTNIQDWFPLGWTGWISLQSKGLSRVSSSTTVQKHQTGDSGLIPGSGRSAGEGIGYPLQYSWAFFVAQLAKNLPAMRETWA